jgi:hypothetical protein
VSSVLLGSSTPEQLIENLGAIQASTVAPSSKLLVLMKRSPGSVWEEGRPKKQQNAFTVHGPRAVLCLLTSNVPQTPEWSFVQQHIPVLHLELASQA